MLYYTIIKIFKSPGKGHFELHNSQRKKDLTSGKPDCMARAISYHDKKSFYIAVSTIQQWRIEMRDRFAAKEVDPEANCFFHSTIIAKTRRAMMKMPYGKYKDEEIDGSRVIDSDYLKWVAANFEDDEIATAADEEYRRRTDEDEHIWK